MESNDFVTDKSVLTAYHGSGGDVYIPDGVTAVGENAFEDCIDLRIVTFPKSLVSIGEGVFHRCEESELTITVFRGSFAEKYCKVNRLNYIVADDYD